MTVIDHIILSHPHRDHVELLPDLYDEYQVNDTWDSGAVNQICGYRAFLTAAITEPGGRYHSALELFATSAVTFEATDCYGEHPPEETMEVSHDSVIDELPVTLGQDATMTFLHADGSQHTSYNENSLVVRFDLGQTRILFMGDSEAGGRHPPSATPASDSIEGKLLTCCESQLAANVLVVGHHGSETSSRVRFLDAVGADTFIVSSGPKKEPPRPRRYRRTPITWAGVPDRRRRSRVRTEHREDRPGCRWQAGRLRQHPRGFGSGNVVAAEYREVAD